MKADLPKPLMKAPVMEQIEQLLPIVGKREFKQAITPSDHGVVADEV